MLFTHFIQRCNPKNALFALLLLLQCGVWAQPCIDVECSQLIVYAELKYPELDASCNTPVGCSDPSRQLVYCVYLQYNEILNNTSPLYGGFYINYKSLEVNTSLNVIGAQPPYFSRINKESTLSCNETRFNAWISEIFSVSPVENKVRFNLSEVVNVAESCPEDQLLMQIPPLSLGTPYARCLLYEVVIDAHPGETFAFKFDKVYLAPEDGMHCSAEPTLGQSAFTVIDPPTFTVPAPPVSSGTNQNLLLQLENPIITLPFGNTPGSATVPVVLKNLDGFFSASVDYFEFIVKAELTQQMSNPTIQSNFYNSIFEAGTALYCYFQNAQGTSVTIPAGGQIEIGKILLNGPELANLCWNGKITIEGNGARISTTSSCISSLSVSSAPKFVNINTNCNNSCAPNTLMGFSVSTNQDKSNCTSQLEFRFNDLGLYDPNVGFTGIEIYVTFETTGTLTPFSVDQGAYFSNTANSGFGNNFFSYQAAWSENAPKFIDLSLDPVIKLNFTGTGCVDNVKIVRVVTSMTNPVNTQPPIISCIPEIDFTNFPLSVCSPFIFGEIKTPGADAGVEDVTVTITSQTSASCTLNQCSYNIMSTAAGEYGACNCNQCDLYTIRPNLELDPLNGVNTWDLILISRHILGLEPLNTPYKLIAADANNNETVTTFDITELRKLILGTYQALPNVPSWRFIKKSHNFINPDNPWQDPSVTNPDPNNPPAPVSLASLGVLEITNAQSNTSHDFFGVKMGDVDGTATPNNRPGEESKTVSFSAPYSFSAKKENYLTVPFTYTGDITLEGLQAGLRFDPGLLSFVAVSEGTVPGIEPSCFNLEHASEGIAKILWYFNPLLSDKPLQKGDILFYITFKVNHNLPENIDLISVDDQILSSRVWDASGTPFRMSVTQSASTADRNTPNPPRQLPLITATPNPTTGKVTFTIDSDIPYGKARIGLFDAFGKTIMVKNISLTAGIQSFELMDLTSHPAGVYSWRIWSPEMLQSGVIIRQ